MLTFPHLHDLPPLLSKTRLLRVKKYLKDFPPYSSIIIYKNRCSQGKSRLWPAKHQKSHLYYLFENSKNEIIILFEKNGYLGTLPKLNFIFRELIFWHSVVKLSRERSIRSMLNDGDFFLISYVLQWWRYFQNYNCKCSYKYFNSRFSHKHL